MLKERLDGILARLEKASRESLDPGYVAGEAVGERVRVRVDPQAERRPEAGDTFAEAIERSRTIGPGTGAAAPGGRGAGSSASTGIAIRSAALAARRATRGLDSVVA